MIFHELLWGIMQRVVVVLLPRQPLLVLYVRRKIRNRPREPPGDVAAKRPASGDSTARASGVRLRFL